MPEVFRTEGYVFSFYSNEGNEPLHIHVRKAKSLSRHSRETVRNAVTR